ncbi:MAG: hypothetical protein AB1631_27030 [Acidobacteriota bacterium]
MRRRGERMNLIIPSPLQFIEHVEKFRPCAEGAAGSQTCNVWFGVVGFRALAERQNLAASSTRVCVPPVPEVSPLASSRRFAANDNF